MSAKRLINHDVTTCPTITRRNRPISQMTQCICAISHSAPFCNISVHTCAHYGYKMLHCGIWHRCILGFVRWVYNNVIMTTKRRRDVVLTSWCYHCIVSPLGESTVPLREMHQSPLDYLFKESVMENVDDYLCLFEWAVWQTVDIPLVWSMWRQTMLQSYTTEPGVGVTNSVSSMPFFTNV